MATDADEIFETMAAMADGASRSAFCRTLRSAADMRGQAVTILDRCYLADWIPTLLMWGAMDPVLPVAHAYIAASAMPSARLEIFERADHFPHHADPMRFLDLPCGTSSRPPSPPATTSPSGATDCTRGPCRTPRSSDRGAARTIEAWLYIDWTPGQEEAGAAPMHIRGKVTALHIGAHKTATSVVQHWLNQNQELHRPAGLQYLRRDELARMIGWGERLIADPAPLAARLARFHADPRFRTLIGSYENVLGRPFPGGGDGRLYPNAERNIQALDRALGRSRCRILLSIRPQPDFVESYYLQSVHQGGWKTFSAWVKSVDLDQLSWQPAVDALHATFGRDRVEVLDFRQIKQGEPAWMEHFLRRVDPNLAVPIGRAARGRTTAACLGPRPGHRAGRQSASADPGRAPRTAPIPAKALLERGRPAAGAVRPGREGPTVGAVRAGVRASSVAWQRRERLRRARNGREASKRTVCG